MSDDNFSLRSDVNLYTGYSNGKEREPFRDLNSDVFVHRKRRKPVLSLDVESGRLFPEPRGVNLLWDQDEVNAYLKQLEGHRRDLSYLREQLHSAAMGNEFGKVRTLCVFLATNGHSLVEDGLLGEKYKESALVAAIVKGSTESALILIDFGGPTLILKQYITKQYAEVLPLHLAIIKQNAMLVDYMLMAADEATRLEMINSKARSKDIHDVCICPWIPMALAASVGSINIVEILLKRGANLLIKDQDTGNTILHILANVAITAPDVAKKSLYRLLNSFEVKSWWKKHQPLTDGNLSSTFLRMTNNAGFTPMSYAVSLGATEFAAAILDLNHVYTFPQWYLGPKKACLYEISEIDPAAPTHSDDVLSVLEMYVYVTSDKCLAFGKTAHLYHAMQNKFQAYRSWFIAFFVYHFLVMVCFTVACTYYDVPPIFAPLLWKDSHASLNSASEGKAGGGPVGRWLVDERNLEHWKKYAIQSLELFVFISAGIYFSLDLNHFFSTFIKYVVRSKHRHYPLQKHAKLWVLSQFDSMSVMLFIFSSSVISLFVLRLLRAQYQDLLYSLALVTGWSFMLFFIRAVKNIGIFTAIMHRIVVRELAYFLVLFLIGTVACGTGMYMLLSMTDPENQKEGRSIVQTFFIFFKVLVGLDEFDVVENIGRAWAAKILFTVFVLFCHILLLNTLIAAMNNRYTGLADMKKVLWMQSRTRSVLFLERRLARCIRPNHGFEKLGKETNDLWVLAREEANSEHPLINFGFDDDVLSMR